MRSLKFKMAWCNHTSKNRSRLCSDHLPVLFGSLQHEGPHATRSDCSCSLQEALESLPSEVVKERPCQAHCSITEHAACLRVNFLCLAPCMRFGSSLSMRTRRQRSSQPGPGVVLRKEPPSITTSFLRSASMSSTKPRLPRTRSPMVRHARTSFAHFAARWNCAPKAQRGQCQTLTITRRHWTSPTTSAASAGR